jgi:zinc transporter ZupT
MSFVDLPTCLGFIACVALATSVQNLTGFAFSLVLLAGQFSWTSALLSAAALPVVHLVGSLQHRYLPRGRRHRQPAYC